MPLTFESLSPAAVLYVFWKLWKRTKFVTLDNMDFDPGRRELDSMADEEAARYRKPTTIVGKVRSSCLVASDGCGRERILTRILHSVQIWDFLM